MRDHRHLSRPIGWLWIHERRTERPGEETKREIESADEIAVALDKRTRVRGSLRNGKVTEAWIETVEDAGDGAARVIHRNTGRRNRGIGELAEWIAKRSMERCG